MVNAVRVAVGILVAGALGTGCALHPTHAPPPAMPAAFDNQSAGAAAAWPGEHWYDGFESAELSALLTRAASGNLDLSMARSRIVQADAQARQAGAAVLPTVDANGAGNFLAGHSANGNAHETDWSALLSASYEVDFWGKNHAAASAASYRSAAAHAERDTVALTTLAGVANGYFTLLSLRERLVTASANLDSASKLLDVVQMRFDAGISNPVELATQKATLATAAIAIPELQQQEEEALSALALLTGQQPEGFSVEGTSLESLAEPTVTAGLPSELLGRRPDIVVAEANLRAADADLLAARAALFPSLTLTANGGVANPALQAAVLTLAGVGPTLNLGGTLVQTIFDGGKRRAMRAEAQAKDEELLASYRAAILSSLVDVENALAALRHLDDARQAQMDSLTQSERAFEGAQLRYQAGSGDFLTVLEAQRTLYAARDQMSLYRLARLRALVSLSKAMGGGWNASNPSTPSTTSADAH